MIGIKGFWLGKDYEFFYGEIIWLLEKPFDLLNDCEFSYGEIKLSLKYYIFRE